MINKRKAFTFIEMMIVISIIAIIIAIAIPSFLRAQMISRINSMGYKEPYRTVLIEKAMNDSSLYKIYESSYQSFRSDPRNFNIKLYEQQLLPFIDSNSAKKYGILESQKIVSSMNNEPLGNNLKQESIIVLAWAIETSSGEGFISQKKPIENGNWLEFKEIGMDLGIKYNINSIVFIKPIMTRSDFSFYASKFDKFYPSNLIRE